MRFNVELSAMASPAYDGRASTESRLLARALERNLRDSGMLDMEALCIAAGRKVPFARVVLFPSQNQGQYRHDGTDLGEHQRPLSQPASRARLTSLWSLWVGAFGPVVYGDWVMQAPGMLLWQPGCPGELDPWA